MASRRKRGSTPRPGPSRAWRIETSGPTAGRRAAAGDRLLVALLATGDVAAVSHHRATPPRRGALPSLTVDLAPTGEGLHVVMGRHPSGAVFFAFPEGAPRRRAVRGPATLRFHLPAAPDAAPGAAAGRGARRGPVRKAVTFVLLRLADALAGVALPRLARAWEERAWNGRPRGLQRVRVAEGGAPALEAVAPAALAGGRVLLFLHGTFSDFQGSYGALLRTAGAGGRTFPEQVRATYGDRLLAFEHFTVSESPAANARALSAALAAALPAGAGPVDVVTYSRGALVLRALLDPALPPLPLGRVVEVAGPNQGTPLVSPARWEALTGWLANLLDLFPATPFTTGAAFVAQSLAWLARQAGTRLPGLAAMNPAGRDLAALQRLPVPLERLAALVADFEPDGPLRARLLDMGADLLFGRGVANDLVVPTTGGFTFGGAPPQALPDAQVGRYGPGGTLAAPGVHHLNFFEQAGSVDFVARHLLGASPAVATAAASRDVRPARAGRTRGAPGRAAPDRARLAAAPAAGEATAQAREPDALDEVFHLLVVSPDQVRRAAAARGGEPGADPGDAELAEAAARAAPANDALLVASFRNARVVEPFPVRGGPAGRRFQRIIAVNERIRGYVDGDPAVKDLPDQEALREFGAALFETLFPGQVRRLYDVARSERRDRRLDVCLTSMIGWVADKPWEFAYDRARGTFLCTEEVNLVRNTLTGVPADALGPGDGTLRILVVAAQPVGAGALSAADEEARIRAAFAPLEAHGLAEVQVEARVTPQRLHELLALSEVEGDRYDVLHFIGHGEFDAESGYGFLLFEDAEGRAQELRADVVRQLVARRGIRLVFLNACETGRGLGGAPGSSRRFDYAQGVAPMLVRGGVPTVVANQYKVLDVSATAFAQHFYWALAVGQPIGDAAREARVAVNRAIAGEAIDWAVPVLFARNPDDVLVAAPPAEVARTLPAAGEAARRRGPRQDRAERVAIWDVNGLVPRLAPLVARLHAAQDHFSFESADLVAPLGTWRRTAGAGEGGAARAFLDAREVEAKLGPTARALGVDHLCCLTGMPLRDWVSDRLAIHSSPDGRISIVSFAGLLTQLRPPDLTLERLLANALAFLLADLDAHRRGPRDCPCYANPRRDIRWYAGASAFCPRCAARLGRGARGRALRALLSAA